MRMAMCRSKWVLPISIVALGIAMFAAEWIGGNPEAGIYAGAVIVVWGLFILLAGVRSETVRALRGDGGDERFRMINVHATAFAGLVLIVGLIVLWMIEVVQGHDGNPYGALSALAGVSYLVALLLMRWRG
jgi:ABC-type Fe3+-siderophore transport system permease subunit